MKKTNKFSKGKTVGIVAASLAAVSLIGVGFSTWIIATKTDASVGGISVSVAETKDISVVITNAKLDENDKDVKFDADETKMKAVTNPSPILSCSSGDAEDLTFTLTYDVTVGTDAKKWQIMAAIDDGTTGTNGAFATAVNTRKYICLPTTLGITTGAECLNQGSKTNESGLTVFEKTDSSTTSTKTYSISQKFTFTWGLAFANKNPVEVTVNDNIYANNQTDGTTTVEATSESLTANTRAMKGLNLSTFKVVLSVGTVSLTE